MARIVMCGVPLTSEMNDAVTFAARLRARGHHVTFVGMPDCEPYLKESGFPFVPIYGDWFPSGTMAGWLASEQRSLKAQLAEFRRATRLNRAHLRFLAEGGHEVFTRCIRDIDADMILVAGGSHPNWALVAHHTGVPCAYLSTMLPQTQEEGIPPLGSSIIPADTWQSRARIRLAWWRMNTGRRLLDWSVTWTDLRYDWVGAMHELSRALGNPPDFLNDRALLPIVQMPYLTMNPEIFEFPRSAPSPLVHYIEPCISLERPAPPFDFDRLRTDRFLAYVSLGSISSNRRFYEVVLETFRRLPGWQLVLSVGKLHAPESFRDIPQDAILVQYAPQLKLLERAKIFISHGGMGSVKESVYFGVPTLLFPVGADQPGNSARAVYHGLGVPGDLHSVTPEKLLHLIDVVEHSPEIRTRLAQFSKVYRELDEERPGLRWIEEQIARNRASKHGTPHERPTGNVAPKEAQS